MTRDMAMVLSILWLFPTIAKVQITWNTKRVDLSRIAKQSGELFVMRNFKLLYGERFYLICFIYAKNLY